MHKLSKYIFSPINNNNNIGYNKIIWYYFHKSYLTVGVFFFPIYIEINSY